MPKIKPGQIPKLTEPGFYSIGNSLYLRVGPNLTKNWVLRLRTNRFKTDLGLGGYPLVTTSAAIDEAMRLKRIVRDGGDPRVGRKAKTYTFKDAVDDHYAIASAGWKNPKHGKMWLQMFENHAYPKIGSRPIDTLITSDIDAVLKAIWVTKNDTARRLKTNMSAVFRTAKSAGHYAGANPVENVALPNITSPKVAMRSMPYKDVPAFYRGLPEDGGVSAALLKFQILTAVRPSEARLAQWSEFDFDARVWTIPAARMKMAKEHAVPLTDEMVAVLDKMRGLNATFAFPSLRMKNAAVLDNTLGKWLKHRKFKYTLHGFRASFVSYCAEELQVAREVSEAALAHATGDATVQAYNRSNLFDRRVPVMHNWSAFLANN